jgi:hypothetical protein
MSCWRRCCRRLGGLNPRRRLWEARRCGCALWKAVYDALVMRLVLMADHRRAVGMLVRRFPAVASLGVQGQRMARVHG